MLIYKITRIANISAFANRKSNLTFKIVGVIFLIIVLGTIIKEGKTGELQILIPIFLFLGFLFYFLLLSVKKLMWFLAKNISYTLNESALLIEQNLDSETEMGFIPRYLYRTGKRKGGYRDVSIAYTKMKSIQKNSKGDLVLKTNSFVLGKIFIPREIENLRDLENKIRAKISDI